MLVRKIAFIVLACSLAGCGAFKPRPPSFSLYERQRLVVLPFANLTQDPALASAIQDDVIAGLVALKACPIAAQEDVAAQARMLTGDESLERDPAARRRIAEKFNSDTIMVGTVNSYSESLTEEPPRRIKQRDGSYRWGYSDVSAVSLVATVKIIDAATGNILWIRKAPGDGKTQRWVDLPWPGETSDAPTEGWERYRAQLAKGKGKGGTKAGKEKEDKEEPASAATTASPAAGQTINIIIQQQATQTQQQEQTQTQAQAQTQEQAQAAVAPSPPKLLYQEDQNVFRARQGAISRAANLILNDYRGRFGWQPGMTPQK